MMHKETAPMVAQTALLVCKNPAIIGAVQSIAGTARHLQLQDCADLDDAWPRLAERSLSLLVVHLPAVSEDSTAQRQLLEHLQATGDSCPIVILADNYRAREAAELLRAGAAEYLGSPFDFAKLSDYVEAAANRASAPPTPPAKRSASWGTLGEDPFFHVLDPEMV